LGQQTEGQGELLQGWQQHLLQSLLLLLLPPPHLL
jgi:hypothetical protein